MVSLICLYVAARTMSDVSLGTSPRDGQVAYEDVKKPTKLSTKVKFN